MEVSPLSPRTPLTPSPSFFAILSPIFTADDGPQSPTLRQLSPGSIPPETPPPWLLAPSSPATPIRPAMSSRQPSRVQKELPSLPRLTTGEAIAQSARQPRSRPGLPSITHSFTTGTAQPFRPPPNTLRRMKTESTGLASPTSPLRQAWRTVSNIVPELKVRPPSRDLEAVKMERQSSSEDDGLEDDEARRLSVAIMGVDSGLGSGFEGETVTKEKTISEPSTPSEAESMEVPFIIEEPVTLSAETTSPPALKRSPSIRPIPAPLTRPIPRSVEDLKSTQSSQSLSHPTSPSTTTRSITISLKAPSNAATGYRQRPLSTHIPRPLDLKHLKSPRPVASASNLRELDAQGKAKGHKSSLSHGTGLLGRLASVAGKE
jgi:hypothetical protein